MWIVGVQVGEEVLVLVATPSKWRAGYERNLRQYLAREHGWKVGPERYRVWSTVDGRPVEQGDTLRISEVRSA